jgi:hypothetical protein
MPGQLLSLCNAGTNTIKSTSTTNGCSHTYLVEITANTTAPGAEASIAGDPILSCTHNTVQLQATSPSSPVTYKWSGPGGFTSDQQNPVATQPGNYTVTVTNSTTGCTSSAITSVNQDGNIPIVSINTGTLTCSQPSIVLQTTITPAGSTVVWTGPSGFTSTDISPAVALPGVYTVEVKAPNGCTTTSNSTVGQNIAPPNITLPATIDPIDCAHPCITVQPTSTTPGVTIAPIQACTEGVYFFKVTDPNNGCSDSSSFTVHKLPDLVAMLNGLTPDCNNVATFTIDIVSGTPPYTYTWNTGATTASVTVQAPVTLGATVTDNGGCEFKVGPLTIDPLPPLVVTNAVVDESNAGAHDGSITLTVGGGAAPYTFKWNTGQTTQNLTGLPGDTYGVTITDAHGCTVVQAFVVHTSVGTAEAATFKYLEVVPNPSEGPVNLRITMLKSAPVSVSVFDATGRLVFEKPEFTATESVVPIDMSGQAQGLYMVSVKVNNQLYTRRLAIVR